MSWTLRNLKELEDSAQRYGVAGTEARFARQALGGAAVGLSYQRLEAGIRQTFGHRHAEQEEVYVVIAGGGRAKLEDEVVELRAWDALRVAPATMRCFEAGPDGLELLAFGAGPAGDVETEPGWWA